MKAFAHSAFRTVLILASLLPGVSQAQAYPVKPVRVIVPLAAGGSTVHVAGPALVEQAAAVHAGFWGSD